MYATRILRHWFSAITESRNESRKSLSETEFPIFCQNIINHPQKAHFIK